MPTPTAQLPAEWGQQEEEGVALLQHERATSAVRPEQMSTFLFGGQRALARRLQAYAFIEQDPLFDTQDRVHLNQRQRYLRSSEKAVGLVLKCRQLGLPYDDMVQILNTALDEITPTDVHMKMAIPTLMYQTTPEQKAKWLPLAQNFQILCAYAQTELGHGSNVRALETTARYDPTTQSFVLHSPRRESMKFWPGGLGKTSTHAIVLARLLLGAQDLGIHSFIVQLRDVQDHSPLPGVTLGDIGPKLGFMSVDNGFLVFNHHRIPRDNMLMGLMEVTPEGQYRKKKGDGAEKILYGAMLDVRAGLVERGGATLARALTIAVRYSAVRKQGFAPVASAAAAAAGKAPPPPRELQVLDYPTQQHALMPLLAWAYVLQATGIFMRKRYKAYLKTLDLSLLPEVHALSSGLKAMTGEVVSDGVDVCRRMCGGHGYLLASGLPEVFQNYTAVQTFEGTAQVLEPQLARFILRLATPGAKKPAFALSSDFDYVKHAKAKASTQCKARESRDVLDPALQVEAFEARVCAIVMLCGQEIHQEVGAQGKSLPQAMMQHGVLLGRLARAHCHLVLLKRFDESIRRQEDRLAGKAVPPEEGEDARDTVTVGPAEVRVLRDLCHLFALSTMEKEMADFRARDYLNAAQARLVSKEVQRLNGVIRAEAVSLVDSWRLSDKLLASALGREDGRVYTHLFEQARTSPLNDAEVSEAYELHWKRLLSAGGGSARL